MTETAADPKELTMTDQPRNSRNAYLPWKRVKRAPNEVGLLARIITNRARQVELALDADPFHPALYLHTPDTGELLRVGLATLVQSVLGSAEREAERWTPLALAGETSDGGELWGNELLTATRREQPDGSYVLSYHWHDRAPIRDWRVGQRVKNELCGPESEGIELYPAESRVMDEANEFWLYVVPPEHPAHQVFSALGQQSRTVYDQDELDELSAAQGITGAVQRDDTLAVQR